MKLWVQIYTVSIQVREPSQITFAFFGILPRTYPLSLHFLCSKCSIFLTTYPPLNANVICEGSLMGSIMGQFPLRNGVLLVITIREHSHMTIE